MSSHPLVPHLCVYSQTQLGTVKPAIIPGAGNACVRCTGGVKMSVHVCLYVSKCVFQRVPDNTGCQIKHIAGDWHSDFCCFPCEPSTEGAIGCQ